MRGFGASILAVMCVAAAGTLRADEVADGLLLTGVVFAADTETEHARKEFLWPYRIEAGPKKYLEWIVKDPVNLATRPFFWRAEQWRTFGIQLGITGVLLPLDDPVRDVVQDNRQQTITSVLDRVRDWYRGETLELYGVGLFAGGLVLRNEKLADSGFLAAESVFYATRLSGIIKSLTKRERPRSAGDQYEFNGPGGSIRGESSAFVSGDVIGAFAFASSVSEVWQNPWVTWPLYIAAGAVAAQRIESNSHWLTDVVGAAFLGHAVGKTLTRFHYRRDVEGRMTAFVTEEAVGVQVTFRF